MNPDRSHNYILSSAYLYLTGECNLRCAHCWLSPDFITQQEKISKGITTDDVKKVLKQGIPLGLSHIKLTGGEPFMNAEIFEIIETISSANISMSIETNGTLVSEDNSSFLEKHRISHISVSLDSSKSSFHDAFRGAKSAWNNAVNGIQHMTAKGLNVQIIMSLVQDNAQDIQELVRLAKDLDASSVKINPIMPVGRGNLLTEKEKTLPADELIKLSSWVEKDISDKFQIRTVFSIPSAFKPLQTFIKHQNAECRVLNILGIISTGDISLCGIGKVEPALVMGNIRKDDLVKIWQNSPVLESLRDIVPQRMSGICGRCILRSVCLGTCRANAFVMSGNLSAPFWICQEAYEKGLFPGSRMI